jgi:hypothetical protein
VFLDDLSGEVGGSLLTNQVMYEYPMYPISPTSKNKLFALFKLIRNQMKFDDFYKPMDAHFSDFFQPDFDTRPAFLSEELFYLFLSRNL